MHLIQGLNIIKIIALSRLTKNVQAQQSYCLKTQYYRALAGMLLSLSAVVFISFLTKLKAENGKAA
jgi:CHASE3 domain sensor protein